MDKNIKVTIIIERREETVSGDRYIFGVACVDDFIGVYLFPNWSSCLMKYIYVKYIHFIIKHTSVEGLQLLFSLYLLLTGPSSISCVVDRLRVTKELNKTNLEITKVL